MTDLLKVNNLEVSFQISKKERVTAISDVSFTLNKKETLCVVGESGCGKSVTANSILRLLPKESSRIEQGEILLDGRNLVTASEKEMRAVRGNQISMIFQEPMTSLNPVQTIKKQLVEMYRSHRSISRREAAAQAVEMLKKVGIPEPERRMKEYPYQLSGGMRQRVMIAMALSSNPKILIADEPTTALDVTVQAQVFDLMKTLQEQMGTALLLITHDMGVVAEMADNVMVMYAGEVVEYDTAEQIFNNPRHPYTIGLLKSIPRTDQDTEELYTIEGTVPGLTEMPKGCHFSTRCEYCTEKCQKEKPKLVQIGNRKIRCHKAEEELKDCDRGEDHGE